MTSTVAAQSRSDEPAPASARTTGWPGGPSGRSADLVAVAGCALMAIFVMGRFWRDPAGRASGINPADQSFLEWMLAHAARSVTHLENPLFSDRLNAADGINTMANVSVLGLAIPLTPVTLLAGPSVAYVVMMTLALFGTAAAWYFVLSRYVVTNRFAAFVGAGFAAFAPGMLSQANGHPQMLSQFLVPVLAWLVFRLGESPRPARTGVVLGLLIAYQMFIGEEVLFYTALTCAVVVLAYLAFRPRQAARQWRPFATGMLVAVGVAGVLLAYPVWWQFFGTGHYRGVTWLSLFNADLGAYPRFSRMTLAGDPHTGKTPYAQNLTELNAFFGWPLLLVAAGIVGWLWKDLRVRIAAIVAVVFFALSLGKQVTYAGKPTGWSGPWRVLAKLPLFDVVAPTRFALVVAVAIAVLLAVAVEQALRLGGRQVGGVPVRGLVVLAVLAAALFPLTPRPLATTTPRPVPEFFTAGTWRQYTTGDGAVMVIPPNRDLQLAAMRWSASQTNGFRITHGYFFGPDPRSPQGYGTLGRLTTPTAALMIQAATPPVVTDADRAAARAEFRQREVAILVLPTYVYRADAVRAIVDDLVGRPGQLIQGVWVWDVRS